MRTYAKAFGASPFAFTGPSSYRRTMSRMQHDSAHRKAAAANGRLAEAANFQVIGGNPLTAEEIAVSRFAIRRGPNKMSLI